MTTSAYVRGTVDDGIATIHLDRPDKLNALNAEMLETLAGLIRELGKRAAAKGLIVTGVGRAFSAGHDLSANAGALTADHVKASAERFHDVSRALVESEVPTVAALNGIAVGGAYEMCLAFDRRIAGVAAEVFLPENRLGLVISNGTSLLLPRLIGRSAALDLVLASRRYEAKEAKSIGLVDEVVDGDVVESAKERLEEYAAGAMSTMQHLRLLRPSAQLLEAAFAQESAAALNAFEDGVSRGHVKF